MNKILIFTAVVILIETNMNSGLNMNKKRTGFSSNPFLPVHIHQQLSRPYRDLPQESPPPDLENNIGTMMAGSAGDVITLDLPKVQEVSTNSTENDPNINNTEAGAEITENLNPTLSSQNQNTAPNMISTTTSGPITKSSTEKVSTSPTIEPPCKRSCLKELEAAELSINPSNTIIQAGSQMTLKCSLSMGEEFIDPNVRWLFKATNMMQTECSLTPQEFIPSCKGFASISESEVHTNISMMATLTTKSLASNNTGIYSCQIEAVCCLNSTTHILRHQEDVTILVWDKDYTQDIIIFAAVAVALLLVVAGSILYSHLKRPFYVPLDDSNFKYQQPQKILHLPMYEDEDEDDSFDENFE
ncbi:uncharacterized protein LOC143025615 [Oratosquilla oratoria]|uniref:uncharacterized protein LOC143025615 n=1 Tax=Oratosquilla oratoria TaxID=337810 RepID=UPI003F77207F